MTPENSTENVSRHVLDPGNEMISLAGYLNREEFMRTLSKSLGQSTLIGFATFVALTFLGDFDRWYIGPYKVEFATVATMTAAYLRARKIGGQYLDEGDPLKEVRK